MSRTEHEILAVLGLCNDRGGEVKPRSWGDSAGCDAPCTCREQCWGAGMLTWAGSTPGGCTPCGWVWASGSARSSSDEPSCGHSSCGSRTWWTGSLGRDTPLTLRTGTSHRGLEFQKNCTNALKGCSRNCRWTRYQKSCKLHRINTYHTNLTPIIARPLYFSRL